MLRYLVLVYSVMLSWSGLADETSDSADAVYHFTSIQHLVEQEVGRIVLPQIYQEMGVQIRIRPYPAKRAQYQAVSGESDGEIMRIYSYGIENPTVRRVPTPYYYLETMAFVKSTSGIVITQRADLSNYRLGKVMGVKHTNNMAHGMGDVLDLHSTEQVIRFVDNGRIEVGLTNTIDGLVMIEKLGLDVVPMVKPLNTRSLYHYVHESHADLVPRIDAKIQELKANGKLDAMIDAAEIKVIGRTIDH